MVDKSTIVSRANVQHERRERGGWCGPRFAWLRFRRSRKRTIGYRQRRSRYATTPLQILT
jgi:hypothetical protein